MNSVLLISGHPDLKLSYANKAILDRLSSEKNIQIRRLDSLYPDFRIKIDEEQQALRNAKLVVFQFPLYWSTYPAIMKQWFDAVFTYGFAFGPNGDQLVNKKVILSITCGATAASYAKGQFNFASLESYLKAALHPVNAAKMDVVDQIITFEMNAIEDEGGNKNIVAQLSHLHAQKLLASIEQHSSN